MRRNAPGDTGRMVAPLVAVSLFFAAALGALSFGLWTANQVVLRAVYGSEEVDRWGLRITAIKPVLRVSNGDTLEEWGFRHFAIAGVVWVPSGLGLFFALRRLMPAEHRRLADLQRPREEAREVPFCLPVGCLPILLVLILEFALGMAAGSALLAAAALSVAWVASWRGCSTTQ